MPMLLVAALGPIHDLEKLRRYGAEVGPLVEAHGGRVLGISARGAEAIEGPAPRGLQIVQRWESRDAFDRFWESVAYQPLKALRHEACESRIVVFEI